LAWHGLIGHANSCPLALLAWTYWTCQFVPPCSTIPSLFDIDGSRDPGSPAGPHPAGTLDGLRPRWIKRASSWAVTFSKPSRPTVPIGRGRSAGASARIPDREDDQGLGPYYGPDLRRQPNSTTHVSTKLCCAHVTFPD
jgi:hypothetical protein